MQLIFKKILILLIPVLISYTTYASINDSIVSDTTDSLIIPNILKFSNEGNKIDSDSILKIFKTAEITALKTGNKKKLTEIFYKKGRYLFMTGNNKEALIYFQQSLGTANQIKDEYYINYSKMYVGTLFLYFSNYNLAMEYNLKALKYFEDKKEYQAISGIYLNLSFIKYEQKDYKMMKEYIDKSLKYSVLAKDKRNESKSLINLSEYYALKGKYKKAVILLKKSSVIAREHNVGDYNSLIPLDLANNYYKLNMMDSATICLSTIINKNINPFFKTQAYLTYSDIYIKENDLNNALLCAENAVKISKENHIIQEISKAYKKCADIYAFKKDYLKAYKFKCLSADIKDSIFSKNNIKFQNELEAVYRNNKKQKEIENLSEQKKINELKNERFSYAVFLLVFVLLGSVIVGLLLLHQNKMKSKHDAAELEQKLLRIQMNPHFIFNSISAIQDYILNNNPVEASSYLSDFAMLMRTILTGSSHNLFPLEKEIQIVENYLKLQQLRLFDKFEYIINISEDIDIDDIEVPPMLSQPFIENAIIHGIMNKKKGKGLISVSYYSDQKNLITEIKDNGIGRQLSKNFKKSDYKSKSIEITEQRIKLITDKYKKNINFEIIDLTDIENKSAGTLVRFTFPL